MLPAKHIKALNALWQHIQINKYIQINLSTKRSSKYYSKIRRMHKVINRRKILIYFSLFLHLNLSFPSPLLSVITLSNLRALLPLCHLCVTNQICRGGVYTTGVKSIIRPMRWEASAPCVHACVFVCVSILMQKWGENKLNIQTNIYEAYTM